MTAQTISTSNSVLKNWNIAKKDGKVSDQETEKIVKAANAGGITRIEKKQSKDIYLKAKKALTFSTPTNNGKLLNLFKAAADIHFLINNGVACDTHTDLKTFGAALACVHHLGFLSKGMSGLQVTEYITLYRYGNKPIYKPGSFAVYDTSYGISCRKGRSIFSSGFKSNNKRDAILCAAARTYGEAKKYIYKPCFSTNRRTSPYAPWCSMPKNSRRR